MTDWLLVGRVARAHGNRGQVIVNLDTDFAEERFRTGQVVQLSAAGRSDTRRIASVRFHQGRPVVAFEGVSTMDAAEALAGAELRMDAAALAPLPEGAFYHHDLVGCAVRDVAGRALGRVTGVEGPMERSRLVVAGDRGELQIPLAAGICVRIDPASKTIVIDPPEGLIELNERTSGSE